MERERMMEEDEKKQSLHAKARKKEKEQKGKSGERLWATGFIEGQRWREGARENDKEKIQEKLEWDRKEREMTTKIIFKLVLFS